MTLSTGRSEYTSWDRGQPDNWRGNQNCAYNNFRKRAGRWDDGGCKAKFQAMCEASGIFNSKCFFQNCFAHNKKSSLLRALRYIYTVREFSLPTFASA